MTPQRQLPNVSNFLDLFIEGFDHMKNDLNKIYAIL